MFINKIINKLLESFISDESFARKYGVTIGSNCKVSTRNFSSEPYLITIGDNVRIAQGVKFFTHGGLIPFRKENPTLDIFGKISVGDNVHIGDGAFILPGVKIESNCIIGAGSVVSKSVPTGSVVAGNPARIVSTLDDFLDRANVISFGTKGMSFEEKKDVLLSTSSEDPRFITKPFMSGRL
ncbi:acyltransferase [Vibrio breoganii]|uniref:Acyltransferase n=1 Tax=Vibrio breoganii TaxID=553239 RepID=A0ABX1UBW2_9VIBR|nr:acyltransferase [Vibrio breoganii]NMO74825.1 acyltransferase [Vibrio breoganii]NMR71939.1 acyltransferase [Vibrio breoganii]PML84898.1 hypothetical protein BCT67_15595 [Vibrio breoganii]